MQITATNSSPGVVNAARKPHLALGLQRREAELRTDSWEGPGMALSRCGRIPGLDDWKHYKSPGRDTEIPIRGQRPISCPLSSFGTMCNYCVISVLLCFHNFSVSPQFPEDRKNATFFGSVILMASSTALVL